MSTHPIDIIANAIRVADRNGLGGGQLAEAVATALTTEQIVENAVEALLNDVEVRGYDSPLGGTISGRDPAKLAEVARIVLWSVGGA